MLSAILLPALLTITVAVIINVDSIPVLVEYSYAFMLMLPFLDRQWRAPVFDIQWSHRDSYFLISLCLLIIIIVLLNQNALMTSLMILVTVALPEEWFFRGYLLNRIGTGLKANIIVSVIFAALHVPQSGILLSALIFIPSLCFGWIYQKTNNIYLVVLVHAFCNVIFVVYLKPYYLAYI